MGWQKTRLTISTKGGPYDIEAVRMGQLAVHPMVDGDEEGRTKLSPDLGWAICFADMGLRMSYGGRTWRDMGSAMLFVEELLRFQDDWSAWFAGRDPPRHLGERFGIIQGRMESMLTPGVEILPAEKSFR